MARLMLEDPNITAAWVGILLGMLSGAAIGLGFHREDWLGGYGSFPRRLVRLGHISFFGLAGINLAAALTLAHLGLPAGGRSPLCAAGCGLLIAGAALMPTVCFLAAWRPVCRHLFFLPVVSLVAGVSCLLLTIGALP